VETPVEDTSTSDEVYVPDGRTPPNTYADCGLTRATAPPTVATAAALGNAGIDVHELVAILKAAGGTVFPSAPAPATDTMWVALDTRAAPATGNDAVDESTGVHRAKAACTTCTPLRIKTETEYNRIERDMLIKLCFWAAALPF